jgi:subtilisin family serine protease
MDAKQIEEIFYGRSDEQRRWTQDFPVLPDVWIAFGAEPLRRHELLLTPHYQSSAPRLAEHLRRRIKAELRSEHWKSRHERDERPRILVNESVVLASLTFDELVRVALPLSWWWEQTVLPLLEGLSWEQAVELAIGAPPPPDATPAKGPKRRAGDARSLERLIEVAGSIWHGAMQRPADVEPGGSDATTARGADQHDASPGTPGAARLPAHRAAFRSLMLDMDPFADGRGTLWGVNMNRPAGIAMWRSRLAVKADAAASLFNIRSTGLCWAVIDTGIDARHPAFYRRSGGENGSRPLRRDPNNRDDQFRFQSRVVRTYDFMRLKTLLDPDAPLPAAARSALAGHAERKRMIADLQTSLRHGRSIDWDLLEPFLRVPHDRRYRAPHEENKHGTHVAGILAGNWPEAEQDTAVGAPFVGMCPDLELYDVRALGPGADEFTIMAALQFIRHLNAHKDLMVIHGVNMSMAVPHDVANFACGRTPVCQECERVVASGIVVVAAAGNRGFNRARTAEDGAIGDYRYISITDPGNAESVITVGATHRYMPHTYGVSYFSSRGPTGDGRTKPDLVAPGERIDGPAPGGEYDTMDGTSMAAPHVSGAAALLMARHRELVGQPARIKQILCSTATDLGREPRFQGRGMLDVLRAIQSI